MKKVCSDNQDPAADGRDMKLKTVVQEAEEGGFGAEVPAIPVRRTHGQDFEELLENLHEAIEGCFAVDFATVSTGKGNRIVEIAV